MKAKKAITQLQLNALTKILILLGVVGIVLYAFFAFPSLFPAMNLSDPVRKSWFILGARVVGFPLLTFIVYVLNLHWYEKVTHDKKVTNHPLALIMLVFGTLLVSLIIFTKLWFPIEELLLLGR